MLRDINAPVHEIAMHLHCGDDKILVDINIRSMQSIQVGIRIDDMTPSFG